MKEKREEEEAGKERSLSGNSQVFRINSAKKRDRHTETNSTQRRRKKNEKQNAMKKIINV